MSIKGKKGRPSIEPEGSNNNLLCGLVDIKFWPGPVVVVVYLIKFWRFSAFPNKSKRSQTRMNNQRFSSSSSSSCSQIFLRSSPSRLLLLFLMIQSLLIQSQSTSGSSVTTFVSSSYPASIAMSPFNEMIYITDGGTNDIRVVNRTSSSSSLSGISIPEYLWNLSLEYFSTVGVGNFSEWNYFSNLFRNKFCCHPCWTICSRNGEWSGHQCSIQLSLWDCPFP